MLKCVYDANTKNTEHNINIINGENRGITKNTTKADNNKINNEGKNSSI